MLKRRVLYSFLAACLVLPASEARAQTRYSADEVKAAFLYSFPVFVTWPAETRADGGLVAGVVNAGEVETGAAPGRGRPAGPHDARAANRRPR